jgi:hypothetical protein
VDPLYGCLTGVRFGCHDDRLIADRPVMFDG